MKFEICLLNHERVIAEWDGDVDGLRSFLNDLLENRQWAYVKDSLGYRVLVNMSNATHVNIV